MPISARRRRASVAWMLAGALVGIAPVAWGQGTPLAGPCGKGPAPDLTSVEGAPDTPPQLTSDRPRTPKFALRQKGYLGTVQLAVIVDTVGRAEAEGAVVVAASDALMRDWACGYVKQLRFTPARLGERAVRTQVVVPFTFRAFVVRREP